MYLKFVVILFISFFPIENIFAQQDSLIYKGADTIVIYKDPVIIKKEIIVQEEKVAGPFAIEAFILPFSYANYYDVCEACKPYLNKLKQAASPSLGFSSGISITFLKKKIYGSLGISYSAIKEKFNYSDSSLITEGKNAFNYLHINLLGGYVFQKNKVSVIIYGGGGISKLLSAKGYTFSKSDSALVNLNKENPFANYSQRFIGGVNVSYLVSPKINLSVGPEYSLTLRSLIQRDHYYVLQRNVFGLKAAVLYFL